MKRFLLPLLMCMIFLSSCGRRSDSELAGEVGDLQGDLPTAGRSLFDQLTMVKNGERYEQQVIFPLEKLRARLESGMEGPMLATLIPKGRSLQRHATPTPFRFPRVVMTPAAEGKGSGDDLGFLTKDRLYMGYVEASNQIEVISYNSELGRFEFQIVDNYGPGLKPRVRYANRAFCLACHQNEAPIFANPGWDETNANPKIQEELLAAIRTDKYLGIPIKQQRNVPNAIDDSTDRANLFIPFQKIWHKGCEQGDQAKTQRCRRLSTEIALNFKLFGQFENDLYAELKALFQTSFPEAFPKGLFVPQNNIPNFNPLQDFTGRKDMSFLEHVGVEVKGDLLQLAEDKDVPAEVEPLKERKDPLMTWSMAKEDFARMTFAIAGELQASDIRWLKSILPTKDVVKGTLDTLQKAERPIFSRWTFNRCRLLMALGESRTGKTPVCENQNYALMPPAMATGANPYPAPSGPEEPVLGPGGGLEPTGQVEPTQPTGPTEPEKPKGDPRLVLFKTYCASCHASGPRNFLEGTDEEVITYLRDVAAADVRRLNWETSARGSMPPATSDERRKLSERPEDRQAMIDILNSL